MFDFSWGEVLMIGAVALIVIGPKDLPGTLRTVGRMIGKVKRMASEFQGQFNEALREADLDKVRKDVEGMNKAASGGFNPVKSIRDEMKGAIDKPGSTAKAAAAATAASGASASNAAAFSGTKVRSTKVDPTKFSAAKTDVTKTDVTMDATPSVASGAVPAATPEPVANPDAMAEPRVVPEPSPAEKPARESSTKPAKTSAGEAPAKKSAAASRKKEEKQT